MPRRARAAAGGIVYHVLNRAVGRMRLFARDPDYQAFQRTLEQAHQRHPIRILSYCVMPNHFHLVLWPKNDGDLSRFMFWLTMTHAQRWRTAHHAVGLGPLYQGRFKAFPVQSDEHLRTVCRYVERNPLRAKLVERAQHWQWCSLWRRLHPTDQQHELLSTWPVDEPSDWLQWVNAPQTPAELEALRTSLRRGRPFGQDRWQQATARRLGLESSFRPPHRPRTSKPEAKKGNTPA